MDPVRSATLVAIVCALLVVCAWRLGIATADAEWIVHYNRLARGAAAPALLNPGDGLYLA